MEGGLHMIPSVKLTSAGAALLAKVPEGYAVPVTGWRIGAGALPPGSSLDRTGLADPRMDLPVSSVESRGTQALVLGQFVNTEVAEAFPFEELGLTAQDPEAGEILMCYGNAFGDGETIQAGTEQLREFVFGVELLFSAAAEVTGTVNTALVFIPLSQKGQPDGVTPLGPDGLVPEVYLPEMSTLKAAVQVTYNGG